MSGLITALQAIWVIAMIGLAVLGVLAYVARKVKKG